MDQNLQPLIEVLQDSCTPEPSEFAHLDTQTYLRVTLLYVKQYPFAKPYIKYHPQQLTPISELPFQQPTDAWKNKARQTLFAFISYNRANFEGLGLDQNSYETVQRQFCKNEIIAKRDELENLASLYLSFIEYFRGAAHLPVPRKECVLRNVQRRDRHRCRFTGYLSNDRLDGVGEKGDPGLSVPIAHGMPYNTCMGAWRVLEALTGISFHDWETGGESNALCLHPVLYDALGGFEIYLDQTDQGEFRIFIRDEGKSRSSLVLKNSPSTRQGSPLLEMIESGGVILPPQVTDPPVSDIDIKYFRLHKAIGDLLWMIPTDQPSILDEGEDDLPTVSSRTVGLENLGDEGRNSPSSSPCFMCDNFSGLF